MHLTTAFPHKNHHTAQKSSITYGDSASGIWSNIVSKSELPSVRSAAGWATQSVSAQRKATPLYSGCIAYFPLALAAIARLSKLGNDKHNPGEPLHWSRDKSNDHPDCVARHLADYDQIDPETGEFHAVAMLWRAAACVQLLEEKRLVKPQRELAGVKHRRGLTPDDRYEG